MSENKEPLKVSDWSQPYKLVMYGFGLLWFGGFIAYFVWWSLKVLVLLAK